MNGSGLAVAELTLFWTVRARGQPADTRHAQLVGEAVAGPVGLAGDEDSMADTQSRKRMARRRCLTRLTCRAIAALATGLSLCAVSTSAVMVTESENTIEMIGKACRVVLEKADANGTIVSVRTDSQSESLLSGITAGLYFKEDARWVNESWCKPSSVTVHQEDHAARVTVDCDAFGGFRLRKAVTVRDDRDVIQISCILQATATTKPLLIVPATLRTHVSVDIFQSPGGAVPRGDVPVDDFAMEVDAHWYAFRSGADGHGVMLVPQKWPGMHRVNWLGHTKDDRLFLAMRIHPMRTFEAGDTVRWSYNLVPFRNDPSRAANRAQTAGPGPVTSYPADTSESRGRDPAHLAEGLRVVTCPTGTAIQVDGQLDEPCWQHAGQAERFLSIDGTRDAQAQTSGRLLRTDNALLVGMICEEPRMHELQTTAKPGSDKVWMDDAVEVFLDPNGDGKTYVHLIVNAAGVQQDNLPAERAAARSWQAAAQQHDARWVVEMRIPFRDLDVMPPVAADCWRINLCRSRLPKRETTCWSPTFKGFHQPHRFGLVLFGDPALEVMHLYPGTGEGGEQRQLVLSLRNRSGGEVTATGSLQLVRGSDTILTVPATETLPEGGTERMTLPYEIDTPGQYALKVNLASVSCPVMRVALPTTIHNTGLNSALYPAEAFDNVLVAAQDAVQQMFFVPANHARNARENVSFVLTVPEGVGVIQGTGPAVKAYITPNLTSREPIVRDGQPLVRWTWRMNQPLAPRRIEKARFFQAWCVGLRPSTDVPPGDYALSYHLTSDADVEPEHTVLLRVIPPLKGRQPKDITLGMSGWTLSPSHAMWEGLLETYHDCGINLVESSLPARDPAWTDAPQRLNMRVVRLAWWYWWNEDYVVRHPDHAAIKADGTADDRAVCPTILCDDDDAPIAGLMESRIEAVIAGLSEGMWWDLEGPGCFKMCFCPRCLARFRDEHDIPADRELNPVVIQAAYADQWVDFACTQSARIAARMKRYAVARGAPRWKLLVYTAVQSEHTRRAYRADWRSLVPVIDVATPSYYSHSASDLGTTFAEKNLEFVRFIKGLKDIPVYNTITTGYGRQDKHVLDGRITKMQIIKSVAFGAQGTLQWWWGPMDGRHYRAYAEASTLIAQWEPFFTQGRPRTDWLRDSPQPGVTRIAWIDDNRTLVLLFNDTTTETRVVTTAVSSPWQPLTKKGIEWSDGTLSVEVPPLDCRWVVFSR